MKQLVLFMALVISASLTAQISLVNYGDNWSYYDLGNQPANQGGLDWNDLTYNDAAWASGNAHLGYGDGDETTVINNTTLTAYFRINFNVADPTVYANIDLNLIYDDGAVVYLNGAEVWRVNMPAGAVNYNTFSSTTSSDNAVASSNIGNSLLTGNNVLAVEIHQRSAGSSDISFDFELVANAPGAVTVDRGPYLQKASPTSMVIKWRTLTATESIINYGTTLGSLTNTASDLTPKTDHEIEITGLTPFTTYYYEIANSATVLVPSAADLLFVTSPVVGSQQFKRFWVLGDCGTADNNARSVRDAYSGYVGTQHTDGILFLGDNAYNDGTDAEYQGAIFQNMYENIMKNTVSWSCLGNHDGHTADSGTQTGPYYDIFTFPTAGESGGTASGTEAYYSFDYGNVHVISLDSYETDRSVGGAMYNWCQTDISNTTADWIIAIWHHPAYTKGSHDSDTEGNLIDMRQNFMPMLEANGVDLILSGHSHSYERSYLIHGHYGNSGTFNLATHTIGPTGAGDGQVGSGGAYEKTITGAAAGDGVVYITTGSAGKISGGSLDHPAMYYSVSALGSAVVEVACDTMNVKFVRETGAIDDFFTLVKPIANCCVPGTPCDDLDPCTVSDTLDVNCICVGIFEDTDSDGVCDANDQCPGQDDALIGTACDDGDACTTNDTYDTACNCAGTFADADGDGVCDANDQCPGEDDAIIGTTCDDGDACTTGDIYDSACNCSGTFADADGDGVCDANDQCPGQDDALIGTACDDGDACTTNDTYDTACNCAGTFADADGDGVCDANDQCPGEDDAIIGTTCDDGDACTTGDIYDSACNCSGTFTDSDSDGVCDANDQCPGQDDALIGTICDDGDACTTGDVYDNACNCSGTFADADGDGVCDANDQCPGEDDAIIGTTCDDGDACTTGDIYDSACNCSGTFADSDGDGVCDANDQCPGQDDAIIGTTCDDGDACTTGDIYDSACNCSGTFADSDGDGVCDANDQCPGQDDAIIGTTCDDGDACTTGDIHDSACNCSGTFADSDGDGVCDANDQCPGQDDALIGTACDDGDACTTGDVYDAMCNCLGTFADADGDGVCDANDQCPGGDDSLDADGDGVPDFCDNCSGVQDPIFDIILLACYPDGQSYYCQFSTNATAVSTDFGWVSGDVIIAVPDGQDIIVTATVADCTVQIPVVAPVCCGDPNPCFNIDTND